MFERQTIKAHSETPGAPVTPGIVLDLMQEKGFDLSGNTRSQVTPEMVGSADRIILMLGRIPPEGFLSQNEKTEGWDMTDPVHMTRETTALIMDGVP